MKFIKLLFVILIGFSFCDNLYAASIAKVKGRKVLIKSDGEVKAGKVYYIISESGKKRGLVKVKKVKGTKAIGVISKKSKAMKGWTLRERVRKVSKRRKRSRGDDEYDPRTSLKKIAFGVLIGMNIANMEVKQIGFDPIFNDATLTGTGFSGKLFGDYNLFGGLWFRGTLGLEQLALEGEEDNLVCIEDMSPPADKLCEVSINYLSADFLARYVFGIKMFRPWIGGGLSVAFPISSASTALQEDDIQVANTFIGALGVDLHFTPTIMMPIQAEFNFFAPADTVSASFIAARIGLAYKF